MQAPKGPTSQQVQKQWNSLSKVYADMDSTPQTFYYTLISMLKLSDAKNILEVGCGAGRLLQLAIQEKSPQCSYYATDISEQMIKLSGYRIQKLLEFHESKLTVQQWCKKNKLFLKRVNNQQQVLQYNPIKFDRIICSLVLMLTENAQNMLKTLHSQADSNCLLGLSVWGNKAQNNFHNQISSILAQKGHKLPESRSNHYLYQKIDSLLEETGWEVVLSWEQNVPMAYIESSQAEGYFSFVVKRFSKILSQEQQEEVKKEGLRRLDKILEGKDILNFPCQLVIARRK